MNLAIAQPTSNTTTDYTTLNMGKIIPNESNYINDRQKTRLVYNAPNNLNRLPQPVLFSDYSVSPGNGGVELRWRTVWEPDNLKLYEIESSTDGFTFQQVGIVPAGNYRNGIAYSFRHFPVNARDRVFYRVRMVDKNGRYDYTQIIPVSASGTTGNYIFPTVVNTGSVSLYVNDSFKQVRVVNEQGRIIESQVLDGRTGRIDIPVNAATGIYFVQVLGNDPQRNIVQRIFIQ